MLPLTDDAMSHGNAVSNSGQTCSTVSGIVFLAFRCGHGSFLPHPALIQKVLVDDFHPSSNTKHAGHLNSFLSGRTLDFIFTTTVYSDC